MTLLTSNKPMEPSLHAIQSGTNANHDLRFGHRQLEYVLERRDLE
jgi:hypothetical protein